MDNKTLYFYSDFTENNYVRLLNIAMKKYEFITFDDYKKDGNTVLWRHDIDISPMRALTLAKIENSLNVRATYLFYPHSPFYNLFENDISKIVQRISSLGHQIGLHVDIGYYSEMNPGETDDEAFFLLQKDYIEYVLQCELSAVSFHQPGYRNAQNLRSERYAGMINAYSENISDRFTYCSDSNGYWRFRRLEEVLLDDKISNLQVLTHPGLWTEKIHSPAKRVKNAIDGRSNAVWALYCKELKESNRLNIGKDEIGD